MGILVVDGITTMPPGQECVEGAHGVLGVQDRTWERRSGCPPSWDMPTPNTTHVW